MFRKVGFTIDDHRYSVLLMGEDEIFVDQSNRVVFLNQTSWIVGETPLLFPSDDSIRVVVSFLSKQIFQEIVTGKDDLLAKYLTSDNKYERDLACEVASYRLTKVKIN